MSPTHPTLELLRELGIPATAFDTPDAPELTRFATTHRLDIGALRSLAAQTNEAGRTVRSSGNVMCLRVDGGLILALRPAVHDDGGATEEILHEVRNAITAVAGWARIARREGGATLRADQALGAIEAAALVAMDASAPRATRARGGASERRGTVGERRGAIVAIGALVAQAMELVEPLAQERRVVVRHTVAPDLRVAMPRGAALSAITNLMKNAIEGSEAGDEVVVRASRSGATSASGTVEITVANPSSAPGVPQIGRSTKGAGRGVGLSVVAGVAQAAGGSLRFSRSAGGLLLATLRLPEPGALPAPSVEETAAQLARERPRHDGMISGTRPATRGREHDTSEQPIHQVLVVDDESSIRSLVTTALSISGVGAAAVAHPDELVGDRRVFELALVDLRLGELDGLEVARQLVAEGRVRKIALMTGAPVGQKPADVVAIVRKPFDLDELQNRIAEWIADDGPRVARAR